MEEKLQFHAERVQADISKLMNRLPLCTEEDILQLAKDLEDDQRLQADLVSTLVNITSWKFW